MTISINTIIYFYMFICIALLLFNVIYILRSEKKSRRQIRAERFWMAAIEAECRRLERGLECSSEHAQKMQTRLTKIVELLAYQEAVLVTSARRGQALTQQYLDAFHHSFFVLALEYSRRPAMERSFYAHLIARYHPDRDNGGNRLAEALLTYFDDSTVFCRENVLQALYALGCASTVEQAFARMNQQGWHHHPRLLSDGLANFYGDREQLAWRLWRRCEGWTDPFQVAVVQFTAGISDIFCPVFLDALQNPDVGTERKFALIRYFQRQIYPPAKPVLLELLAQEDSNGLAIAAAAVLFRYPGEDTYQALMEALHSRNWYIRHNAASSLVALGSTYADAAILRKQGDRYAAEMLEYMLEKNRPALAASSAVCTEEAVV